MASTATYPQNLRVLREMLTDCGFGRWAREKNWANQKIIQVWHNEDTGMVIVLDRPSVLSGGLGEMRIFAAGTEGQNRLLCSAHPHSWTQAFKIFYAFGIISQRHLGLYRAGYLDGATYGPAALADPNRHLTELGIPDPEAAP
jgi:hypothetical protein